ncbi:MAG TPA: class I SAM-dependent methyltransferase [Stellaceae bacterium]
MNAVLGRILETGIADDETALPLSSNMDAAEGELITSVFREVRPDVSVEIGLAHGVSALFACEALAANGKEAVHIVLDPTQHSGWNGAGLKNLTKAGYRHFVDFHEERSEIGLPKLLAAGTRVQAAIIDGWHTFDHALVDFFFVNKMLDVGGIVILDDTDHPSVSRVADHIKTYPAYQVFDAAPHVEMNFKGRVRRALAKPVPALRRSWDRPRCMAFRKIAEDSRNWDWHVEF